MIESFLCLTLIAVQRPNKWLLSQHADRKYVPCQQMHSLLRYHQNQLFEMNPVIGFANKHKMRLVNFMSDWSISTPFPWLHCEFAVPIGWRPYCALSIRFLSVKYHSVSAADRSLSRNSCDLRRRYQFLNEVLGVIVDYSLLYSGDSK